jgi:aminoglycoside 3-N-acetyltransferase I
VRDRSAQAGTSGGYASIRLLGPEDLAAMHGLLDLYGEAFEEPGTYGRARPDEGYLRRLLAAETFIALVAEHAGEVVGGLCAYVLPKFE